MLLYLFVSALSISVALVLLSVVLAVLADANTARVSFDCWSHVGLLHLLLWLPVNCTPANLPLSFAAASADQHVDPARAVACLSPAGGCRPIHQGHHWNVRRVHGEQAYQGCSGSCQPCGG